MKISDVKQIGEAEEFEPHSRTALKALFDVSFAHESGYEDAFNQLLMNEEFKAQLSAAFAGCFKDVAQKFVRHSEIPPGFGWMDDIETGVAIQPGNTQRIE